MLAAVHSNAIPFGYTNNEPGWRPEHGPLGVAISACPILVFRPSVSSGVVPANERYREAALQFVSFCVTPYRNYATGLNDEGLSGSRLGCVGNLRPSG